MVAHGRVVTSSRQITEVKQHRAWLVFGWVTGAQVTMPTMCRGVGQASHVMPPQSTQQWWVSCGMKIGELWMVLAAENALNSPQRRWDRMRESSDPVPELKRISDYKHTHLFTFIWKQTMCYHCWRKEHNAAIIIICSLMSHWATTGTLCMSHWATTGTLCMSHWDIVQPNIMVPYAARLDHNVANWGVTL